MRAQYIDTISCLLGRLFDVNEAMMPKYRELDNYRYSLSDRFIHGGSINEFHITLDGLEKAERDVKERLTPFFRSLHDEEETSLDDLDHMIQELKSTLEQLDCPVSFNYVEDLPGRDQLIYDYSDDGYLLHFKAALKNEALKTLKLNLKELDSKQQTYNNRYTTPENNKALDLFQRSLTEYRQLEADIANKKRLHANLLSQISGNQARAIPLSSAAELGETTRREMANLQAQWESLEAAKEEVLLNKPEIGVIRDRFDGTEGLEVIQRELLWGFEKSREAIADAARKVSNDDMPLSVLSPVLNKVLEQQGVLPEGSKRNDRYSLVVNSWIKRNQRWDTAIKIAGSIISLGCAIALFIPGVGGAAAIAIGLTGSVAGGVTSAYNFERLADLNDAAISSRGTSLTLVDDPEAIHKEYIWAIADLILAGVDLGGAAFEVAKLAKWVSRFDNPFVGNRIVLRMNNPSDDVVDATAHFFNGLDESKQLELLDYVKRHKDMSQRLEVIEEIGVDEIFNPIHGAQIEDRIMNITIRDLGDARMRNVDIVQRLEASQPSSQGIYRQENLAELRSFQDDVNMVLRREGVTLEEFQRMRELPVSRLSPDEAKLMKSIREMIPPPTNQTLFQKVIHEDDIMGYLLELNGQNPYSTVGGFVTEASDMRGVNTYADVRESLRLDYTMADGSIPYLPEMESYGVIRFKTENLEYLGKENVYAPKLGGINEIPPPGTGHGFTSARNGGIIPEYSFSNKTFVEIMDGAELYRVDKNGVEILIGVYDKQADRFIPIESFTREAIQ